MNKYSILTYSPVLEAGITSAAANEVCYVIFVGHLIGGMTGGLHEQVSGTKNP